MGRIPPRLRPRVAAPETAELARGEDSIDEWVERLEGLVASREPYRGRQPGDLATLAGDIDADPELRGAAAYVLTRRGESAGVDGVLPRDPPAIVDELVERAKAPRLRVETVRLPERDDRDAEIRESVRTTLAR